MVCFENIQKEIIDQLLRSFNPLQKWIPNMDL